MFKVLVCDRIADEGIELLKKDPTISCNVTLRQTPEMLKGLVKDVHAIIVRSETKITAELIEAAPVLKVIGRAGSGLDTIDVKAAQSRGIVVVNVPDASTVAVAELTMAMLLLLSRPVLASHNSMSTQQWERAKFMGTELSHKTLGIIGLGRIGSAVADRAHAFGMKIVAFTRPQNIQKAIAHHVQLVEWPNYLHHVDFLSLHIPLSPDTRAMIGKKEFALMKPGVKIVNCSRGHIMNEAVLCESLQSGHVGGLATDVYDQEPPWGSELLKCPNIVHTPHIGASTKESQARASVSIAKKVRTALEP